MIFPIMDNITYVVLNIFTEMVSNLFLVLILHFYDIFVIFLFVFHFFDSKSTLILRVS